MGAKDIPSSNNFNGIATVYNNTPAFKARAGDLVVFNSNYGGGYGHVAIVLNGNQDGNYMKFVSLDQNWQGGGWTSGPEKGGTGWESATKVTHTYDFPQWFIRPKYKAESKTTPSKKEPDKKKAESKKKAKKLNYIRDEVRGYRLPNRGYKPKGVVLHNDAGSVGATAKAYHNGLVNAPYSRLEAGVAHSYISGNTVYQALPESRIAWHTA